MISKIYTYIVKGNVYKHRHVCIYTNGSLPYMLCLYTLPSCGKTFRELVIMIASWEKLTHLLPLHTCSQEQHGAGARGLFAIYLRNCWNEGMESSKWAGLCVLVTAASPRTGQALIHICWVKAVGSRTSEDKDGAHIVFWPKLGFNSCPALLPLDSWTSTGLPGYRRKQGLGGNRV